MITNRLKKFLPRMIEGILAVSLVLIFFSVFLYFLNALFPTGTGLRSLISLPDRLTSTAAEQGKDSDVLQAQDMPNVVGEVAATLSWTRNSVKSKGSEAIAWQSAAVGKLLYDRDAVQTLNRSAAQITFDEENIIDMGSNSLLIIKQMDHDPVYHEKRSFMVLVDGDLHGHLGAGGKDSMSVKVGTPGAMVTTRGGSGADGPVDFKISVNPDNSSTIAVYSGSAEVVALGQTVMVGANQATVVGLNQAPMAPGDLPDRVHLKTPSAGGVFYYRDLPPKIRFAWRSKPSVTEFHYVLARDSYFHDIITDEVFSTDRFNHGNLKKGTYYWKVSAKSGTIEGLFSETRQLNVVRDTTPPALQVHFPPGTVSTGRYILRGKAEPGARVFVGGKRVSTTSKGKFEYRLKLRPGMNVIVVEAIDSVDNVAYRSRRVVSKY